METRQQILSTTFQAMRKQGFQGLRPDKEVAALGITKGAFYHYFPNKTSLGYAIVDELLAPKFISVWAGIVTFPGNPIDYIASVFGDFAEKTTCEDISLGCPLNNLIQEMSPLDEGFRSRLELVMRKMQQTIAAGLALGISRGQLKADLNPDLLAWEILGSFEGAHAVAKVTQSAEIFKLMIKQTIQRLQDLRTDISTLPSA